MNNYAVSFLSSNSTRCLVQLVILGNRKDPTHLCVLCVRSTHTHKCICVYIYACYIYHSVQNLLSSRLLSKDLKIKIYRTIILPVVLYGCETWSLTLREERKLRVSENMFLRRIFGPRRDEVTGEVEEIA